MTHIDTYRICILRFKMKWKNKSAIVIFLMVHNLEAFQLSLHVQEAFCDNSIVLIPMHQEHLCNIHVLCNYTLVIAILVISIIFE